MARGYKAIISLLVNCLLVFVAVFGRRCCAHKSISSSSSSSPSSSSSSGVDATDAALDIIYDINRPDNSGLRAIYPGDIVLSAVFPIHERHQNLSCGALQEESLLELEALAFTLKRINDNSSILPGIRLGVVAIDSCDSPHHALEQSLVFIKSFVCSSNASADLGIHDGSQSSSLLSSLSSEVVDSKNNENTTATGLFGQFDRVLGLIGGQSSEVSLQLANVLRLFKVPQVSYMSTSPTLSSSLYDYFFRTVPSDINQVEAIVEILESFHWTYVSVVYSDTEYGNNGYGLLSEAAKRYNICISNPQEINSERFTAADYERIITTLMHKINARVVVVFADRIIARRLMMAAKNVGTSRFVWIASDAWSCRESVVQGLESVVEGTISVTPLSYKINDFIGYFQSLKPEASTNNPWFDEFWQRHFRCVLPGYYRRYHKKLYGVGNNVTICDENLIMDNRSILADPAMHFVRDAFYTFAITFHKIHQQHCGQTPGICPGMRHHLLNSSLLAKTMLNVRFEDEGGNTFRFQGNGDAPPRYEVVNFQLTGNGTYEWKPVGTYLLEGGSSVAKLRLNQSAMRFKRNEISFPQSFCSEPCTVGQAKLQLEGDTCCWLCTNCSYYEYLPDEFHCQECPLGTVPNHNKTDCLPLAPIHISFTNWWTISAMIYAVLGMLGTGTTFFIIWHYSDTPIMKAAGRELSFLHLCGIFLSFIMSFVVVSPPNPLTCGGTRVMMGASYTICYAAIATKTNRIARIFRHRSCKKPRFTSPMSQVIITILLIAIEIVINILWMIFDPPHTVLVYPTRSSAMLICSGSDGTSYLYGLVYPFILICFCMVYAFKTRKCPEGYNEARFITFANYTTCVVWLAFLPMFVMLSTTTPFRYLTLCYLMSVSGTVQLLCLFGPKIYVAVLRPEKNTRETVMCGSHYSRALYANQCVYRHNLDRSDNGHYSGANNNRQHNNNNGRNSANNNNNNSNNNAVVATAATATNGRHSTNMGGHISVRSTATPTTTMTTLPDQGSISSEHEKFVPENNTGQNCKSPPKKDREVQFNGVTNNGHAHTHHQYHRKQASVSSSGNAATSPPPTPSPSPLFGGAGNTAGSSVATPEKAFVFYPMEAFCHLARISSQQRLRSTSSPMLNTSLIEFPLSPPPPSHPSTTTTTKTSTTTTKHHTNAVLADRQRWPLIKLAVKSDDNTVTSKNTATTAITESGDDKQARLRNGY